VKARIGGNVNADWVANTCAVRMSEALNCVAGRDAKFKHLLVPYIKDNEGAQTLKGGNKLNYVFRVRKLFPLLERVVGKADIRGERCLACRGAQCCRRRRRRRRR
jgi:hypothetical protein